MRQLIRVWPSKIYHCHLREVYGGSGSCWGGIEVGEGQDAGGGSASFVNKDGWGAVKCWVSSLECRKRKDVRS